MYLAEFSYRAQRSRLQGLSYNSDVRTLDESELLPLIDMPENKIDAVVMNIATQILKRYPGATKIVIVEAEETENSESGDASYEAEYGSVVAPKTKTVTTSMSVKEKMECLDYLKKLHELRQIDAISEEEYEKEKSATLEKMSKIETHEVEEEPIVYSAPSDNELDKEEPKHNAAAAPKPAVVKTPKNFKVSKKFSFFDTLSISLLLSMCVLTIIDSLLFQHDLLVLTIPFWSISIVAAVIVTLLLFIKPKTDNKHFAFRLISSIVNVAVASCWLAFGIVRFSATEDDIYWHSSSNNMYNPVVKSLVISMIALSSLYLLASLTYLALLLVNAMKKGKGDEESTEEEPTKKVLLPKILTLAVPLLAVASLGVGLIGYSSTPMDVIEDSTLKRVWNSKIESYVIPEGVTSIGEYAFKDCTSLTSVTIPDSVTYISNEAFYGCTSLTSVTIPSSVASIGNYAFYGCSSLTNVAIPDSVASIGDDAFRGCSSLKSVTLPSGCLKLISGNNVIREVVIAEGSESIPDYAFYRCTSLTSVTIPDSVASIGEYAFFDCISLKNIIIPSSVTSIGYEAFYGCTSLESVTLPSGCLKLISGNKTIREVVIAEGGSSIPDRAFFDCTSLTSVTIPSGIASIGDYAFYGCSSLTNVAIPDSVTSIGRMAFSNCTSLTSVTIPDSVTSIGDYAFFDCTSLTSVTIPDSVTSIGNYAFYGCSSLTSITIPDSVTSIAASAFSGCISLTIVTIPSGVTYIGEYAFSGCSSLAKITIPSGVTSIGNYAFRGCPSLTSVAIPDSVTSIGDYAFKDCTSLTIVTVPGSVTSIGYYAFSGCTLLTDIYCEAPSMPSGWDSSWDSGCSATVHWGSTGPQN